MTAKIVVLDPHTGRHAELVAHQYGIIKWTKGQECLLFLVGSACGPTLTLFDPMAEETTVVAVPTPFYRYGYRADSAVLSVETREGLRLLQLPGPIQEREPWPVGLYPQFAASVKEIYVNSRLVLRIADKSGRCCGHRRGIG